MDHIEIASIAKTLQFDDAAVMIRARMCPETMNTLIDIEDVRQGKSFTIDDSELTDFCKALSKLVKEFERS